MGEFSKVKEKFEALYESWEVKLAEEKLTPGGRGKFQKHGWTFEYLIATDEKGLYLDYYATNRMTSDSHMRIYADGSVMELPALAEMFVSGKEAEFVQRNREIGEMLRAKGFGG